MKIKELEEIIRETFAKNKQMWTFLKVITKRTNIVIYMQMKRKVILKIFAGHEIDENMYRMQSRI